MQQKCLDITKVIGSLPFRLALAGGWIDQPFMSRHNPDEVGSMVVVSVEPEFAWMNRAGICSSTRSVAIEMWNGKLPGKDRDEMVRALYYEENKEKDDPSGSQDMIGLLYPGINRLDYDFKYEGGVFPRHIESCNDVEVANWLSSVLYILPVNLRPHGYHPLEKRNFKPEWVQKLGQSGKDCYTAIVNCDAAALGQSLTNYADTLHVLLPDNLLHHTLRTDLVPLLEYYQSEYHGAMYSGAGGGYLFVISEEQVPGGFQCRIRVEESVD